MTSDVERTSLDVAFTLAGRKMTDKTDGRNVHSISSSFVASEVKAALVAKIGEAIDHLYPNVGEFESGGRTFRCGSIDGDDGQSCVIAASGSKAGLWYDHATGESGDALDMWARAKGIAGFGAVLEDAAKWLGIEPQKQADKRGQLTAAYVYRDRDGVHVATIYRYEKNSGGKVKKTFRQYDEIRKVWKSPPIPKPLYRAELIKGPSPQVVVVEGEKCVDALSTAGVFAVSAMGGSGADPKVSDWSALAGCDVILWPDADDVGRQFMARIGGYLAAMPHPPASIRIFGTDERPSKWDAADAVGAGENIPFLLATAQRFDASAQAHTAPAGVTDIETARAAPTVEDAFEMGRQGPLHSMKNAKAALDLLGVECRHNLFSGRREMRHGGLREFGGELNDTALLLMRQIVRAEFGFDPGETAMREGAWLACSERAYDPLAEYLDGLHWDGVKRVDSWAVRLLGASDTPYSRAVGRLILRGAVCRGVEPGSKLDTMVVLEGRQATGKSSAVRALAGAEWFSDEEILSKNDQQRREAIQGVWFFEIAELAGLNKADLASLKSFLTRLVDRGRPAYGRHVEEHARRCIFIGTTNESQYLRDATGNRRFVPLATGRIDLDGIDAERDQLFAEAMEMNELPVLPPDVLDELENQHQDRFEVDPWEELLADHVFALTFAEWEGEYRAYTTMAQVYRALDVPKERQSNLTATRIRAILMRLGYQPHRSKSEKRWFCPAREG